MQTYRLDWWRVAGAAAVAVWTGLTLGWLYGLGRLLQMF
jgi:hypothetical protein